MSGANTTRGLIWGPWKKLAAGINTALALMLALIVTILLNCLSGEFFHWRRDVSSKRFYELSDRTKAVLSGLKSDVSVHVIYRAGDSVRKETLRDIVNLLKEYQYAAGKQSSVRFRADIVDPDRDLARMAMLKEKYGLETANVVVVDVGGKTRIVPESALAEYDYEISPTGNSARRVRRAFMGEQALTSAILSIVNAKKPVVYFVVGHGENAPTGFREAANYSEVGRAMSFDNIDVKVLDMTEKKLIPGDCDLLVVAGPRTPLLKAECAAIGAYLKANRSLLLLVESGYSSGLEPLMEEWGLALLPGKVVEKTYLVSQGTNGAVVLPTSGDELYVRNYNARHPITASLKGLTSQMYRPAPIAQSDAAVAGAGSGQSADRPRINLLAFSTADGWLETNARQDPPRFNQGADSPGPIPVAAAVERGPVASTSMGIKPTRIVVFGDSEFVADGLARGANMDFFMNAVNWLLERDALVAIGPKLDGTVRAGIDHRQRVILFGLLVPGIPGIVGLIGICAWLRRVR